MKRFNLILTLVVASNGLFAQSGNVGIGTNAPTNKLHVTAVADPLRLQGVKASSSNGDKTLVIDANGVVKTALSDQSNFAGFMTSDLFVPAAHGSLPKITIQTKLVDKANEYNTGTGIFTPTTSGVYEYEIEVTVNVPSAPTQYASTINLAVQRGVIGLANASANQWVGRFNFQSPQDDRSYYAKGVANLVAGTPYYFAIGVANASCNIVANPTGLSGSGIGTYFSIKRVQ